MSHLDTIKQYHTLIWDKKDIHAVDQFFDSEALIHSPVKTTQGTESMKSVITQWHQGFPDLVVHWDDFICEDDKVVSRWHAEGTQRGEFLSKQPTNNKVTYSGMTIYQLRDNKIVQYWAMVDMGSIEKQLSA